MPSIRAVSDSIADLEGFDVRIIGPDGRVKDGRGRLSEDYLFINRANQHWTVMKWRTTRFEPQYPGYTVEVLDGAGEVVHGGKYLSTVRESYETPDLVIAATSVLVNFDSTSPTPAPAAERKPFRAKKATGSEPLGVEDTLWKAADKLRGSMDSSEYKHIVLGLVFLKYIDDAFTERRKQIEVETVADGLDEADIALLLEEQDEYSAAGVFWVPPESRWPLLQANAKQPDIGKLIDHAMDMVEVDNPSLRGVLPKNFARPALDVRRLGEQVDLISGLGLGSAEQRDKDMLGRVYEYFLGKFASVEGKGGGEYYTPRSVVKLLVEMIEPYHGRIYDPCCGSGGMFIQSERFVEAHGGQRNDISIYGQELNDTTWRLAKMNLAIRGIEADLGPRWGDTFHDQKHDDLKADYILANPPFNISDWGGDQLRNDPRWSYGVPPAGNANYAWLQHIASKLSPRGIAGVVLANGSLSSQASGEGQIRQAMIEADLVECIVALPGQLFYSTQIPASLWFLNRDKANGHVRAGAAPMRDRRGEILFIDCSKLGVMVDRTHREFRDAEIGRIAGTYHAWRGEEENDRYQNLAGFSSSVSAKQIRQHGFALNPGRYVGAAQPNNDTEPISDTIRRLRHELLVAFDESERLQLATRLVLDTLNVTK